MSGFKNFAVAGAGNLGSFIIEELLKLKSSGAVSSVSFLTRSSSGYDELIAKGAKLVTVDYNSPESLKAVLSGVDVVISTLGGGALTIQEDLAKAAKDAGVQLFVPSEFGNPTEGETEGFFALKNAQRLKAKEIGIPYALFYTGPFSDFIFKPDVAKHAGFDFTAGKVVVSGSGTAPISFTSRLDIARYVAHVLTTLPRDKLEWRTFRIEGDRTTFNDIIAGYQAKSGNKLEVSYRPRSELEEALKKNPADFFSFLLLSWDLGKGLTGHEEELANKEFPEWNPEKVVDVILDIYRK